MYPLSSTVIPGDTPGVYPLSSTIIPDHIPGDGGAGMAGGVADPKGGVTGTSRGGTDDPDGKQLSVEQSSSSYTLSPSSTMNANDLRTFSLTEVSLNSTLVALSRSSGDEAKTVEAVVPEVTETIQTVDVGGVASLEAGGQQAGIQESVKYPVVEEVGKNAGVREIRKGKRVHDIEKGKGVHEVARGTVKVQATSKNVEVDDDRYLEARDIGSQDMLHRSPSPLVTKEDICQIVRTEIEPILQVRCGQAVKYSILTKNPPSLLWASSS